MLEMLVDYVSLLRSSFPFQFYGLKKRVKVHLSNLFYAFKGELTRKSAKLVIAQTEIPEGLWGSFQRWMEFMLKYYDPKDYVFGPIISATATAVHLKDIPYYDDTRDKAAKDSLEIVSDHLHQLQGRVAKDKWEKWLSCYPGYLEMATTKDFELIEKIKETNVLEIGPGIGAVMLWLENLMTRDHQVISYDLQHMQLVQKSLHQQYSQTFNSELSFKYFNTIPPLEAYLKGKQYAILSFYAFNEIPLPLRTEFENLIRQSAFSLFVSNRNFDEVDNDAYFEKLALSVEKEHHVFPVELKGMRSFHARHRIHLYRS